MFRFGDKIRVISHAGIDGGFDLTDGGIYTVIETLPNGDFGIVDDGGDYLIIYECESHFVEKVADIPEHFNAFSTQEQRVETLEKQVEELQADVAALVDKAVREYLTKLAKNIVTGY